LQSHISKNKRGVIHKKVGPALKGLRGQIATFNKLGF
jgi:hypothetical protein